MKDHPILFSGEMVRAILDGRKTQTRRVIKPRCVGKWNEGVITGPAAEPYHAMEAYGGGMRHIASRMEAIPCPYGKPGDRLWVREAWQTGYYQDKSKVRYRASCPHTSKEDGMGWKPSIHMKRKDSRILLEVTGVRVERVQEISEQDARADSGKDRCCLAEGHDARVGFQGLWDSINDKRGFGWDVNPWVWAVAFRRGA